MRVLSLGIRGKGPRIRRVVRVTLGLRLDVYHNIFLVFKIRLPVLNCRLIGLYTEAKNRSTRKALW